MIAFSVGPLLMPKAQPAQDELAPYSVQRNFRVGNLGWLIFDAKGEPVL
ncbi:MAG TPA: hypothetical protein VFA81_10315 [Burkholderiales bacterium]|nr:hypothetical protein [Burkholderiales bacterium]